MRRLNVRGRLIFRHALLALIFLALYVLLARPQVIFFLRPGFTAWYPASGLILALLLGVSPRYAILAALADWLSSFLSYHQAAGGLIDIVTPFGPALCYGIAAQVLRGPLRLDLQLQRRTDVVRFVFVSAAAAAASTAIGVSSLALRHAIQWKDFWAAAAGWFWGDGVGLLGVAPFLLIYVFPWVRRWLSGVPEPISAAPGSPGEQRATVLLEAVAQAAGLAAVLWLIFGSRWRGEELLFLAFVPIIWVALRPGIRRVVIALLLMNFGIVGCMHLVTPSAGLLARIGFMMLTVSATGLIVGAAVTERQRIAGELHARTAYLNALTENAPLGVVVLDASGRVELTNAATKELFAKTAEELRGARLEDLVSPEDSGSAAKPWSQQIFAGPALRRMVRGQRRDGGIIHLELNAVPLRIDGRMRGAYALFSDVSEQVREASTRREHAESLDRLVNQLEAQTMQIRQLNEMAQLLQCCGDSNEASAVAARSLRLIFPKASAGVLYTYRSSRNLLETAAHWGGNAATRSSFAPMECWGLRRGQSHWSDPSDPAIACAHLKTELTRRCLCVPMIAQGDTNGVLHLEYGDDEDLSCDADQPVWQSRGRLAMAAAAQIALSLASLEMRESLRDQSIRDPLTGLFNRRFLEEGLERELQRAQRSSRPVAVLFMDLDRFKHLNDTFGHQAGDFVLRSLAEEFRGFFRAIDLICRYGGEEFAAVLPDSTAEQAARRANDLRVHVGGLRLQYKQDSLDRVSVSIGIAAFPEHGRTSEELIKLADRALYEFKAAGRNCVRIADALALLEH